MIMNVQKDILNGKLDSLLLNIINVDKNDIVIIEDDIIFSITTTQKQNNKEYYKKYKSNKRRV